MKEYGFMLIDKPKGITSFDIIRKLRKIIGIKKIGHSGTLDPFATGLMIYCIGKATRLCSFIVSQTKEYIAKIQLGIKTDTLDIEGNIISSQKINPFTEQDLILASNKMLELKEHFPPKFSAKKINGKRAYQLARENKEVVLSKVPIEIYTFQVIAYTQNTITYKAKVSKGTYIRVISEIFASYLKNIATTVELRRTQIGDISIEDAIKLNSLTSKNYLNYLITPEKIIKNYRKIFLNDKDLLYFKNGRFIKTQKYENGTIMVCDKKGICIGFAEIKKNKILPKIVLI